MLGMTTCKPSFSYILGRCYAPMFLFYLVIGALQMFFDDDDDDMHSAVQLKCHQPQPGFLSHSLVL